ncbi:MAG: prepilin-type N-terminal cleavage/methylation domain-containing protein [Kiritimatiellae bacterium]|nr:prepilin-type N-terminal cleavage/methylation domain-containing protein [Kiritimatiellia bacterium]
MNTRQKIREQDGFTIVELIVGMLAGAILALTAGIILVEGFKVVHRNAEAARIQRDGSIAMEMLQRTLREVSGNDVSLDSTTEPPKLEVDHPHAGQVSFEAMTVAGGTNLVYIAGGRTTVIAARTLRSFTVPRLSASSIRLLLSLEGNVRAQGVETERVDFDAIIHFRN